MSLRCPCLIPVFELAKGCLRLMNFALKNGNNRRAIMGNGINVAIVFVMNTTCFTIVKLLINAEKRTMTKGEVSHE